LYAGKRDSPRYSLLQQFLDQLQEQEYQFLLVDPNGDYSRISAGSVAGGNESSPSIPQMLDLLSRPDQNAILNLTGIPLQERTSFFRELWPRVHELRARTGRPHWIVITEAQALEGLQGMQGLLIIANEPNQIPSPILSQMDLIVASGGSPTTIVDVRGPTKKRS
jgi:hypothetical protein